ncbi:hypothetical protein [Dongia sp.]|uniref:hypothetical protein n=1 Tax=Dongia sp. TaxID=1977262 RepID=UPI0035AF3988
MTEMASTVDVLRKRVVRLLKLNESNDPSELTRLVLPRLQALGNAALIGGAIRDLAIGGRRRFSSDLDFVVYDGSRASFHDAMTRSGARPNRFGGFALKFPTWKVDVWHIEDTWAHTAGLKEVHSLKDLLKCTFFDWDSIVFDVSSRKLICEATYLSRLRAGVMEVRLLENPNPDGSLVRALRRAALWDVKFGLKLCEFSISRLRSTPWDKLVALDDMAFSSAVLRYLNRDILIERLEEGLEIGRAPQVVPRWNRQPMLPFSDNTDVAPMNWQ